MTDYDYDDEEDTRDPREVYLLTEPEPEPQDNSDVSLDDMMAMLAGSLLPSDIHRRRMIAEQAAKRRDYILNNIQKVVNNIHPDVLRKLLRWAHKMSEVSVQGISGIPSALVIPAIQQRLASPQSVRLNKEEKRAAAKANHGRSKCRNR